MKGSSGGDGAGMDKAHGKAGRPEGVRRDLTQPPRGVRPNGNLHEVEVSQQGDGRKPSRRDLIEQGRTRPESVNATDERRQNEILETLESSGFFKRPEIQAILDPRVENPQRFQNLKEAISAELVIRDLHLDPQQFEIYRSVVISEKIPGVSTLQEWRDKNNGNNLHRAYMYKGAVWRTVGEADILVLQKQGGSPTSSVHSVMEVKTGSNDKAAKAQRQLDNVRVALERFEKEPTEIGIHRFQRNVPLQDLTDHITRHDAAQFDGQTWGPGEKDSFSKKLPLGSRDFRHVTEKALNEYGGQTE